MSMGTTETSEPFQISTTWFGPSLVVLRVLIGWHFLYAGLTKLLNPSWTATEYLLFAIPEANPLMGFWQAMAQSDIMPLITFLNMWGLTLVGIGLIIGGAVRWNAFWGSVMMLFYYLASLPLENSIIVDYHIIYIATLFGLGAFGAGRFYGLDEYVEEWDIVQTNPWLRYLLG